MTEYDITRVLRLCHRDFSVNFSVITIYNRTQSMQLIIHSHDVQHIKLCANESVHFIICNSLIILKKFECVNY